MRLDVHRRSFPFNFFPEWYRANAAQDASRAPSTIDHTPPGTLNAEPLPPLVNANAPNLPAKELSGYAIVCALAETFTWV